MKTIIPSILFVFAFQLISVSACAPAAIPTMPPTSVPPTFIPLPTNTSVPTDRPKPTETPEPTATPIQVPDTLNSTFSNFSVTHRDSFQYVIDNVLPAGWECDEKYAGWITKDNQFKIQSANSGGGTVCYFSQEKITPQKGVYFTFKYTGTRETFTIGFDANKENGERIAFGEGGFHSVAMQMENMVVSAHIIKEGWQNSNPFNGNLKLREDTWYDVALGLDDKNDFIIKIWQPEDPQQQITYFRKWDDFPHSYYYISWISSKRSLLIDDFTVFNFGEIAQQ